MTNNINNRETEFFTALALFKSSDINSALKLRDMLLTSIAKKKNNQFDYHRIPVPISSSTKKFSPPAYEKKKYNEEIMKNNSSTTMMRQIENKVEIRETVSNEDVEIPTISIPDEEFIDLSTCKVCDGAKIGPLILLECEECQDTYHPLCHQPPVVDIDIYDPRVVWRCHQCFEIYKYHNKEEPINYASISKEKMNNKRNQENFNDGTISEIEKNPLKKIRTYSGRKKLK